MTNFWRQSGIPHRGWYLLDVIDSYFPSSKDWTFNDFILRYSFPKIKEFQLEKI